jgi:hypothetical protein
MLCEVLTGLARQDRSGQQRVGLGGVMKVKVERERVRQV